MASYVKSQIGFKVVTFKLLNYYASSLPRTIIKKLRKIIEVFHVEVSKEF